VGGIRGVGEELSLGGSFGLDVSIRGRYANFGKVSTDSLVQNGTSISSGGPFSLATLELSGNTVIVPTSNSSVDASGGAAHYASLDFSGIDAKVALNLYF
jgi:hypothetical protein